MFDGSELGNAIAAHPGDTEAALAEYEQALFRRGAEFAAESDRNHKLMFGDNTPDSLLRLLTGQELQMKGTCNAPGPARLRDQDARQARNR
jgi:2-polyprenyl-6-methoxyphenol hydroxylase-like FAD-dependent oxidoreductase